MFVQLSLSEQALVGPAQTVDGLREARSDLLDRASRWASTLRVHLQQIADDQRRKRLPSTPVTGLTFWSASCRNPQNYALPLPSAARLPIWPDPMPRVIVHWQNKNAAFSPVACGDPNCRAHKGSVRLGAKE